MSNPKHTPGPWTFDAGNRDVVRTETGCNPILIAQLYKDSRTEANAHLIAAAPEMLEALKKIHAIDTSELGNEFNWFRFLQVEAAHAIKKAKGGYNE